MMEYLTEQEVFWSGKFGDDYIQRNKSENLFASNINFFSKAFSRIEKPSSIIEFGANIGMNLKALQYLYPYLELSAIELNKSATMHLEEFIPKQNVIHGSILDFYTEKLFDVVLIKGVLIHVSPDHVKTVYQKLYETSQKYILVAEYYNPTPVSLPYRGEIDRLFKRDFAGDMLDLYPDLVLRDYGFVYHRDPQFPQDDITYFLLEKK